MSSSSALDAYDEFANAVTACVPWLVAAFYVLVVGPTWLGVVTLVGWSFHLPCAIAYHVLLAMGRKSPADILLRMDQTTQLLAATCNMVAQSHVRFAPLPLFYCFSAFLSRHRLADTANAGG